jgi:TolB-like protein/Tfp pilus assembly protein PilF
MQPRNLIVELRRRNVFRVAVAYLAASWLIIQLVNEIGPILDAPEWLPKVTLALLSGGFLVALVLSWVYEFTSEGIKTTAEVDEDASLHSLDSRKIDFAIIGLLVLALGYFIWESRFRDDVDTSSGIESIAVLPFRDMSTSQDQSYFADGMAEELLNALSRIEGLKVAGRTSSFSFRNSDRPPAEIASQLNVSHLLEGGVRSAGGQLRVTAQLVNARDGLQVWSHEFEGSIGDVFSIQDEISRRVIESLEASIEVTATSVRAKTDVDAYNEYLLGRYQLARRTLDGLHKAQAHFEAAAATDPSYSPAWSSLATTLAVSPWYGPVADPGRMATQAREAAQRAIALDSGNAEAWAALGTISMIFDRKWKEAEVSLRRAIELNPTDAGNTNLYGDYLYITGDYAAAEKWEGLAAELEPLSAVHQHELALVYDLTGRLNKAIEFERRAIDLNPEFGNAWGALARLYSKTGDLKAVEQLLDEPRARLRAESRSMINLYLHHLRGNHDEVERLANELLTQAREGAANRVVVARLLATIGDEPSAVELVTEAQRLGDPVLVSPLYFFLPEDWSHMPQLEAALAQPGLAELHDLRRANIAAGRGRVQSGS